MILIAYDGSPDAQAAVDHAAALMPGAEATVVTVWERLTDTLLRTGSLASTFGAIGSYATSAEGDAADEAHALARATDGADRATAAGLRARPLCAARRGGVAATILATAADEDSDVVVMGTRGLGEVKSFLLGSEAHAVVQHADRPVLVVPSPAQAAQRAGHALGSAATA